MTTRLDELVGHGQRIDESAAYRLDVEGCRTMVAEFALQQTGSARKNDIGRRGGDNDQVQIASVQTGGGQCSPCLLYTSRCV